MSISDDIVTLLTDVLRLAESSRRLTASAPLLGHVPELDSMAVLAVIQALEERFGIRIDDDEISAETFESVSSLTAFVEAKQASSRSRHARSA